MVIDAEFEEIDENGSNAESELDLSESDSLPWLETDDEDVTAGGIDTAQIVGFGVVLLTLLIGIVGAIYFMTNGSSDPELVADGSTIEAPEGPIKERPDNPGGKEFAGTGNVAPAVGEGQMRETQISSDTPAPSISTALDEGSGEEPNTSAAAQTTASQPTATQPTGGAYVQLAAYGSRSRAEQGWRDLSRQTDSLSGKRHRVVEAVVSGATVYRLQVVLGDRAAASQLCSAIKADGLDCAVK